MTKLIQTGNKLNYFSLENFNLHCLQKNITHYKIKKTSACKVNIFSKINKMNQNYFVRKTHL